MMKIYKCFFEDVRVLAFLHVITRPMFFTGNFKDTILDLNRYIFYRGNIICGDDMSKRSFGSLTDDLFDSILYRNEVSIELKIPIVNDKTTVEDNKMLCFSEDEMIFMYDVYRGVVSGGVSDTNRTFGNKFYRGLQNIELSDKSYLVSDSRFIESKGRNISFQRGVVLHV